VGDVAWRRAGTIGVQAQERRDSWRSPLSCRSQPCSWFQLPLFWSANLRSSIQAEAAHHRLTRIHLRRWAHKQSVRATVGRPHGALALGATVWVVGEDALVVSAGRGSATHRSAGALRRQLRASTYRRISGLGSLCRVRARNSRGDRAGWNRDPLGHSLVRERACQSAGASGTNSLLSIG
jgi:hypothetical protein